MTSGLFLFATWTLSAVLTGPILRKQLQSAPFIAMHNATFVALTDAVDCKQDYELEVGAAVA